MAKYGVDAHQKAATLYLFNDKSYGELTEEDDLPNSKGTFTKWAQQGKGTGGKDWNEMKKTLENERSAIQERDQIETEIQSMDQVVKNSGPLLVEAAEQLFYQLQEEGDSNPTWTKFADLVDKIGQYKRRSHVAEIHNRLEQLASEVGKVVGRNISDETEKRQIRTAVQRKFNQAYRDIDELMGETQ